MHPHLHQTPLRQKSLTTTPYPLPRTNNYHPSIENSDLHKHDTAKPKIMFNYSPSTPKFAQDDTHLNTPFSPPKPIASLQNPIEQPLDPLSTPAKVSPLETTQPPKQVPETLQFSKPILLQRNKNQFQKRKELKSKSPTPNYDPIAEVVPTLEDSHHDNNRGQEMLAVKREQEKLAAKREQEMLALKRDQEMVSLRRELNESRSQNNQLRTELLRYESKLQQREEAARRREEELVQELKEVRIELQKALNEKLLAEVSEAELHRKIRKIQDHDDPQNASHDDRHRPHRPRPSDHLRDRPYLTPNYDSALQL